MPAKKTRPTQAAAKPKTRAPSPGQTAAKLECAECGGKFATSIAVANFEKEVAKKFDCPSCGAVYELVSLQESRITVTILARGETRTYGKTYDIAAKDYARPL